MLAPALLDGDYWPDVEARLVDKTAQLWATEDAAMVTEIWGDCLHVWLGGGTLKGLLKMRPKLEQVAREWGLKRATINGRPGWARALLKHGYRRQGEELEKCL